MCFKHHMAGIVVSQLSDVDFVSTEDLKSGFWLVLISVDLTVAVYIKARTFGSCDYFNFMHTYSNTVVRS